MTYKPSMLASGGMSKPSKKPARRGPGRPPQGRQKIMVSLEPAQVTELRREALAAWIGRRP